MIADISPIFRSHKARTTEITPSEIIAPMRDPKNPGGCGSTSANNASNSTIIYERNELVL